MPRGRNRRTRTSRSTNYALFTDATIHWSTLLSWLLSNWPLFINLNFQRPNYVPQLPQFHHIITVSDSFTRRPPGNIHSHTNYNTSVRSLIVHAFIPLVRCPRHHNIALSRFCLVVPYGVKLLSVDKIEDEHGFSSTSPSDHHHRYVARNVGHAVIQQDRRDKRRTYRFNANLKDHCNFRFELKEIISQISRPFFNGFCCQINIIRRPTVTENITSSKSTPPK